MNLVMATLMLCIAGGSCESHQLRIEKRACGLSYAAEVALNGEWHQARASIRC